MNVFPGVSIFQGLTKTVVGHVAENRVGFFGGAGQLLLGSWLGLSMFGKQEERGELVVRTPHDCVFLQH